MNTHPYCNGNEHGTHPPLLGNEDGAVEQRGPHHCHRDHLHTQGQSLVFPEILYIWAKMLVRHEPLVQPMRAAHIQGSREQQERRSWQHRQKNAHNTQHQRHATQKCKKELHSLHLPARRYKKYPTERNYGNSCRYFSFEKFFYLFFIRTLHTIKETLSNL